MPKPTTPVSFRASEELMARLRAHAERQGLPVHLVVPSLLSEALGSHEAIDSARRRWESARHRLEDERARFGIPGLGLAEEASASVALDGDTQSEDPS